MYRFIFDEQQSEDTLLLERDGVALMADPLSLQYLTGADTDDGEDLSGAQFVVGNLNVSAICGCGSSFSV